jgi:LAS superfamily LD-carboxypeptidase LdcB
LAASVEDRIDRALGEAAALAALDDRLSREIVAEQVALARRLQAREASRGAVRRLAPVPLREVRGIVVNAKIAEQLDGMLAAAEADGFVLGGGGYRDPAEQIALRRQHCGPSDYEIYDMPSSECTPPTARPGRSMHERGLAVDLTSGGEPITSRDDPAFRWLDANAGRWGFKNLPSEPWHWSTTGR